MSEPRVGRSCSHYAVSTGRLRWRIRICVSSRWSIHNIRDVSSNVLKNVENLIPISGSRIVVRSCNVSFWWSTRSDETDVCTYIDTYGTRLRAVDAVHVGNEFMPFGEFIGTVSRNDAEKENVNIRRTGEEYPCDTIAWLLM